MYGVELYAAVRLAEMFVPLVHAPGHAQVDFGEARAVIGGVARKLHFFAFDLPHSDVGKALDFLRTRTGSDGPGCLQRTGDGSADAGKALNFPRTRGYGRQRLRYRESMFHISIAPIRRAISMNF